MFATLFDLDVDECTSFPNICGANAGCHNTDGSYICNCKAGYTDDGKNCSKAGENLFDIQLILFTTSERFHVHWLVYFYHQTHIKN